MPDPRADLPRTILATLALLALIGAAVWILRPFIAPILWATMIVVATWPLLRTLQRWCFGSRVAAVTLMMLLLVLVLVVPLALAIDALIANANNASAWTARLDALSVPPPPANVRDWPVVGPLLERAWTQIAALTHQELLAHLAPEASGLFRWFMAKLGTLGALLLEMILTMIVAAVLYAEGEVVAHFTQHLASRLSGDRGVQAVRLAGQAIRGIALGVVGTALIQTAFVALGLAITGVPPVTLLAGLCFLLAVAQIGPVPVLVPATAWLFWSGHPGLGWLLVVWTLIAITADNVLRPLLIKRGADLPFLLIIAGVVGGLMSFGLIGIFVGPVILAVSWTLLEAWVGDDDTPTRGPPHP